MPELKVRIRRPASDGADAVVVDLLGFIDASTHASFQQVLDRVLQMRVRFAILDFRGVAYINSSGIMALLQAEAAARDRKGEIVVVQVPRSVGWTMHMLGLPRVVPFLRNESDACEYVRAASAERPAAFPSYLRRLGRIEPSSPARYVLPMREAAGKPAASSVLLVVSRPDHFSEIIRRRFHDPRGRFFLVHNCVEALRSFDEMAPDVVILEDRVRYAEEFLSRIRIDRRKSLVPVIKIYPNRRDLEAKRPFKFWENDYLIEPFELMELFALAETELRRVTRARGRLLQQVHLEFQGIPKYTKQAAAILEGLLSQSGLSPEAQGVFHPAILEAIDNGIRHGNRKDPRRSIDLRFLLEPDRVTVTVEDQGDGFDAKAHLDRLGRMDLAEVALQEKRRGKEGGGLGILMMLRGADKVDYDDKGRRVRLVKLREGTAA